MSEQLHRYLDQVGLSHEEKQTLMADGVRDLDDLKGRALIERAPIHSLPVSRSAMLPKSLEKKRLRDLLVRAVLD